MRDGVLSIPLYIHAASSAAMLGVALLLANKALVYLCFLIFEVQCGLFFPTYGTLRSIYIPEQSRAAIMNFFRIPLNAIVLLLLLKVKAMDSRTVFFICAAFHGASLVMFSAFASFTSARAQTKPGATTTAAAGAH